MSQMKAMFDRATLLYRSGQRPEAIAMMEKLAKREPNHPTIASALASMLADAGQLDRALYYAQIASTGAPKVSAAHQLLATILAASGRLIEAEKAARKSLDLDPTAHGALNTLGIVLSQTGRQTEAASCFERALELHPDRHEAAANYARLLVELGRADEAVRVADRAVRANPNDLAIASARAFIMNYPSGIEPREVFEQHRAFGRSLASAAAPLVATFGPVPSPATRPEGPIVLGYLSSDFRAHSVVHFVEHLLERHDRSQFRACVYHTHGACDAVTERCRGSADLFRHVNGLDDATLARRIRDDGVDVLVDLNGLSAHHRAGVLALRPAPVQISYCGYCNTTGLAEVDARIVDAITDPLDGDSDALAVERLIRLDRCFLAYRPPAQAPAPRLAIGNDAASPIWFGSFNAPAKISEQTLDMWCRILGEEDRSRMLIKGVGLEHEAARDALLGRIRSRGIDASRVRIVGPTASTAEHLDLYAGIHVALDTTPYSGTTTTCEALWMGVPVVTLRGAVHASRVGASLLTSVGHPEWIADSPESYASIALGLGRDSRAVASLRSTLRQDMERSALRDESAHTGAIEHAYTALWNSRIAGR